MVKGLFTSLEEIGFQEKYIKGNVKPPRDPNVGRFPDKKPPVCVSKKQNNGMSKAHFRQFTR